MTKNQPKLNKTMKKEKKKKKNIGLFVNKWCQVELRLVKLCQNH